MGGGIPLRLPSFGAPKTNGMAIASLVFSLVWFVGLGSLLAVIFGLVARKSIKQSRGTQSGDGLAIAGLVIGIAGLLGATRFIVACSDRPVTSWIRS